MGAGAMSKVRSSAHVRQDPLLECLELLLASTNPFRLVLLRETALDSSCIDHGDIDLLGTESAVERLIQRAFELVKDGRCHMQIRSYWRGLLPVMKV